MESPTYTPASPADSFSSTPPPPPGQSGARDTGNDDLDSLGRVERSSSSMSSYSSASTASAAMMDQDQRELTMPRSDAPSPTPSTLSTLSLSGLLERSEAEQQLGTAVAPDHVPESSALRRIRIFTGSSSSTSSSVGSSGSSSLDRRPSASGGGQGSGQSQSAIPSNTTAVTIDQPDYLLSSVVGGVNNRRRRSSAAYFVAVGGGSQDESSTSTSPSLLFGPGGSVVSNVVRGIHSFSVTALPCQPPTTTSAMSPPPSAVPWSQQPAGASSPGATHPKACASTAGAGVGLVVRSPRQSMYTSDPLGLPPSAALATAIPPPISPASSKSPSSPAAPAATAELTATPPPPATSSAAFHQHFPRRPRPAGATRFGISSSPSSSPPPPEKVALSIDTQQHEHPPRTNDVAVLRPHSLITAPEQSATPHSPNALALHPMQRALIDRLASMSDDPSTPRSHAVAAAEAPSTMGRPPPSPGTSTQQPTATMGLGVGGGAMPAFRAIVTTDVRGTVRTANDRFSALVAHLVPRAAAAAAKPAVSTSPSHSPSSSASSSSTSPTLGHHSTAATSPPKRPPIRKGFVVFDLDTHPEPTRAGSSAAGSPAGGATPDGSPAPGGRALLFGAQGATSPRMIAGAGAGVSMIGTNVLDLIVPGHREKIAKKVGKKVEAVKRRVAGAGEGAGGEVDEVLVAGRIVRLQRELHGRSVPVSLWIKARLPSPTSTPATSFSSSSPPLPTSEIAIATLDPVLLWVIEEIHEVALHCTVTTDPGVGPGLPMVSRTGPWTSVFPSLASSDNAGVCRLAQVIPALSAPNALDLIDSIRFFSASDNSGTSAFPVLIHRDHPHHSQSPPNSRSPSPASAAAAADADSSHVSLTLLVLPHIAGMITVDDRATICAIHPGLAKQLVGKAAKYLVGEPLGDVFPLLPNVIRRLAARSTGAPAADGSGSGSSVSLASAATSSLASLNAGAPGGGGGGCGGTVVDEPPAGPAALARMGAVADGPVVSAATIRRLATSMAAAEAAEGDASTPHKHKHHHLHHHHVPSPTTTGGAKPGVFCVHRDGGRISCDVQVRPLATLAGRIVFSLWVTFDHAVHRWALPAAAPAAPESPTSLLGVVPVVPQPQPPPLGQKLVGKSAADYDLIHRMGEGAYGQVQLVRDRSTGKMLALKLIDKDKIVPDAWTKRKPYGVIPREIAILADLYDDAAPGNGYPGSIVKMVGFWEGAREFGLEMQVHGEGVDLFEYIERMKGMSEEVARRIFYQVCTAVAYLHARKVCHRDIKDENVILDHQLNAQLIDFGSAAYVRSEKATFDTFAGTLEYCSPEVILGKRYQGKPQDIWALGILMYVMLFRECPFFTDDEVLLRSVQVPKGIVVSAEAVALLRGLLNKDLAKRPTIEQVVAHKWFDAARAVDVAAGEAGQA